VVTVNPTSSSLRPLDGSFSGLPDAAVALTRLLQGLLFGVGPLDPASFISVAMLLLATGVLASYLPAPTGRPRRARVIVPIDILCE
jgi:hypothetical protein